jgi:hypothetical protein
MLNLNTTRLNRSENTLLVVVTRGLDGFGGLVVSMLASGSRVRGFEPDRCFPSEEK